ncbi:ATP-dependent dethiobiotin synthetase BioD [Phormidium tenue FACHB-886]|nr:ATP-dependent dethiobiotin synthetase BioD [Phormidium tenue FACHB-886]
MNALLIAGTDTGVGKTIVTTALAAYWQRYYAPERLGVIKPIECGTEAEADRYTALSLSQSPESLNPIQLTVPLAPPIAADRMGEPIRLEIAWQQFEALSQQRDFVLVESTGGLGSPITHETTMADLAWDWRLPTVLVVPVRSGAIAHAVANVALAQQARVHLKGIILNCVEPCSLQAQEDWMPIDLIQVLTQKPVLGCIPHLSDPTDLKKLVQVASNLELERLIPLVSLP